MGEGRMGRHAGRIDQQQIKQSGSRTGGDGSLEVLRIHRRTYKKQKFASRLAWTLASNILLLAAAFRATRRTDAILFTGSPPLMVHFIAPRGPGTSKLFTGTIL
jgi:hypothetical protein